MNDKSKIVELYNIVNDNQELDGEYWYYIGYDSIIKKINTFNVQEILLLINNLSNWSSEQLFILANGLIYESSNCEKIKTYIDYKRIYYKILSMVNAEDVMYLCEPWELILEADLETLKIVKQRRLEFQKNNPNIYKDGKLFNGWHYESTNSDLNKAIAKACR